MGLNLASSEFWRICKTLQVWTTLDAFTYKRSYVVQRYITRDEDLWAVAVNTLNYYWDLVTWLFPLVPLIPLALERVQKQ